MDFVNWILSFLPTWVFNLVQWIAADKVVSQPDHQATQKVTIKPGTRPESPISQSRPVTRDVTRKLRSDLNRREQEHQQELTRLKRHQRQLECKITKLLASKDEESEKMEKLVLRGAILQKEIDHFHSDFICKDQRYQSELEKLTQRRAALAEKNTRLLAMKDEQLERMRNFLSRRDAISKQNEQLQSELDRQQVEYQKEMEKQKTIVAFKNSKLEKMERLFSEQENLSRNLKEELNEVNRSKQELAAKLLMKEAESMSHDTLVKQLNEELSKAQDSKQKLAEELSKKEAQYVTISQVKDDRIKKLEVALSTIKEKVRTQSSITNDFVKPEAAKIEKRPQRKGYNRDTLMQYKNFVAPLGIRQHLVDLGILRDSHSLKSSPTNNEGVKPKARTFGKLFPEMEQGHRPKRETKLIRSQEYPKIPNNANVWKPQRASLKTEDANTSTDATLKTVRGILNKLTPSNYKKLLERIQNVNIDNQDCLTRVIKVFFEKAVDEPMFSPSYAQMCSALSNKNVLSSSNPAATVSFRKLLLLHCQKQFEKDSADLGQVESKRKELTRANTEEKKKLLEQELNEMVDKIRRVSLGNIKFIGELFKIGMISFNVMHKCIRQLLNQYDDEESLECLCKLLTVIGKDIERPLIADEAGKLNRVQFMNSIIQSLNTIIGARKISNRLRFMIQGVIELRTTAWKPRRPENGPKVIKSDK